MAKENAGDVLMIEEVLRRTGLSRAALYRRIERGVFPMSKKRCGRVVWDAAAVEAWIAQEDRMKVVDCVGQSEAAELAAQMAGVSDKLLLLANALLHPANGRDVRTDAWWSTYALAVGRELKAVSLSMPGLCAGIVEFERDLPADPA